MKCRIKRLPAIEYEAFFRDPVRVVRSIAVRVGSDVTNEYIGYANHGIVSNIVRHCFDGVLRVDDKWKDEAPIWFQIVTGVIYLPILLYISHIIRDREAV